MNKKWLHHWQNHVVTFVHCYSYHKFIHLYDCLFATCSWDSNSPFHRTSSWCLFWPVRLCYVETVAIWVGYVLPCTAPSSLLTQCILLASQPEEWNSKMDMRNMTVRNNRVIWIKIKNLHREKCRICEDWIIFISTYLLVGLVRAVFNGKVSWQDMGLIRLALSTSTYHSELICNLGNEIKYKVHLWSRLTFHNFFLIASWKF